jgi:hypothetical protein
MPKFEIKTRVTHTDVAEFETVELAKAHAFARAEKSQHVSAVVQSIIQIDPPLPDRPCPGCHPGAVPRLVAPEIEIDLGQVPPPGSLIL